ncbi:hypothetical protein AB0C33_01415 [Nonomuraea sp. NPDC048881]|uniref:hypothetical protein n=1 Tax=Nonomuraea sp. NPDC048881 TaxID=3155030 RepID=UPI0033CF16DD
MNRQVTRNRKATGSRVATTSRLAANSRQVTGNRQAAGNGETARNCRSRAIGLDRPGPSAAPSFTGHCGLLAEIGRRCGVRGDVGGGGGTTQSGRTEP